MIGNKDGYFETIYDTPTERLSLLLHICNHDPGFSFELLIPIQNVQRYVSTIKPSSIRKGPRRLHLDLAFVLFYAPWPVAANYMIESDRIDY